MNTLNAQPAWFKLAIVQCPKLSAKASGLLTFEIWRDVPADAKQQPMLYLALSANEGGGYFSLEKVPMNRIEECLRELQATGQGFPAIKLKPMFVGRSSNNPSFMAAVLRHEGILTGAPENPKLHLVTGDIESWKSRMLALTPIAEEFPAENPEAVVGEVKECEPEKPSKKRGKKPLEPESEVADAETQAESVDESHTPN